MQDLCHSLSSISSPLKKDLHICTIHNIETILPIIFPKNSPIKTIVESIYVGFFNIFYIRNQKIIMQK